MQVKTVWQQGSADPDKILRDEVQRLEIQVNLSSENLAQLKQQLG